VERKLLYTLQYGRHGALLPFMTREDVDFFTHLEMHMRQENPPLCGRDHLSYRSSFVTVKVHSSHLHFYELIICAYLHIDRN